MKKLYRSSMDKKLAGVLGGLAEYMGVDASLVRVGFILLALVTAVFPMVLAYVIWAMIVPTEEEAMRK
ncbi:PspC domain-containing protein [Bacillus sp. HMF5848]|uniref:PspC domain-containing protein n=1 Tax=Bacillus sp. HMF5848 TaxID=2495421 RepID=UPI000F79567F|nr:PspC domain-containing protein [Bacillus sp. HMF5848]RSK28575.1 PspC domain-containing protein [Bacillus sp. HMF5848]